MRMMSDGRKRRTAAEWRAIVEAFEASGVSALAFCQREGLSRAAFTRWRQQLQRAGAPEGAFVELGSGIAPAVRPLVAGEMELTLPGAVVLRWRP